MTVTVVGATGSGHLTLFPEATPVPTVSTINFAAGRTRSNNAVLTLTRSESVPSGTTLGAQAFVAGGGQVHVVLDVNGYWE